jgi:hypothetical protein
MAKGKRLQANTGLAGLGANPAGIGAGPNNKKPPIPAASIHAQAIATKQSILILKKGDESMKCIGAKISEGEYQGHRYKNVHLTLLSDLGPNVMYSGTPAEVVSVKYTKLQDSGIDWQILVGSNVTPLYNRYGKVESVAFA